DRLVLSDLAGDLDTTGYVLIGLDSGPYGIVAWASKGDEIGARRATPEEFEYNPDMVSRALLAARRDEQPGQNDTPQSTAKSAAKSSTDPLPVLSPPSRPPILCAACGHRSAFFAARSAFGPDTPFFGDIGCYTLGFGQPLDATDVLLCMGAGFSLADGVSRVTGQRTVGIMGDSTFFHSGMPVLLNAVKAKANMVAIILDDQVTAMAGFQ
ncbi:MAG: hypothetical protein GY778_02175, partial [bacterium]|nr:hypothetical protein [bacterium]